ncbi:phage tail sheath C-terminal domain-containing protein [Streptomyces sp. NPDC006692]|uniref:phage tail sheath C-terminal domain-containing protein n=1 Tax=unclassified Streptomyces TaxID=2593676 RepID=UPI00368ACEDC
MRTFPGREHLVWDARTLAPRDEVPDYVYLNVRRLVCFLRDSITQSGAWTVFEPNDEHLWATLMHSITAFLTDQWRQGALQGTTADQAFYVVCDSTSNTPDNIERSEVNARIGVAPVQPAEFVEFTVRWPSSSSS